MFFLGLCVIITAIFATSLSQMELEPGQPSPFLEGYHLSTPGSIRSDPINLSVFPLFLRIAGMISALYLLVALYSVVMGIGWKKLLRALRDFSLIIAVFALVMLVVFLLQRLPGQPARTVSAPPLLEPPVYTQADSPPAILVWVIGISLAVLAAILLFSWVRARRGSDQMDLLAREVEKARRDIVAGMNLDEVILRCYREMEDIIHRERAIKRQAYTTPAEFERELCSAGLPQVPVHQLTRLFESVRYGCRATTRGDEQGAISNLHAIASYLRRKKV